MEKLRINLHNSLIAAEVNLEQFAAMNSLRVSKLSRFLAGEPISGVVLGKIKKGIKALETPVESQVTMDELLSKDEYYGVPTELTRDERHALIYALLSTPIEEAKRQSILTKLNL